MSTEKKQSATPPVNQGGIKKKNLIIIGLVFVALWVLAILSESLIFLGIVGVLTLIAAGIAFWAWRYIKRQNNLANMMQRAGDSPEARKKALAALEADPKANDSINLIARAQLLASDAPAKALALLDPIDIKNVPASAQDDFAIFKSQLLLNAGRAKHARPLVDWVNLDNPQRKEMRPLMVAVVAETWARTGSAKEANTLLDTLSAADVKGNEAEPLLMIARVFAQFAAGKKGLTRSAIGALIASDPNLLGRFLEPKSQVHPGLKRLAREAYERSAPRQRQSRQSL